MAKMKNIFTWRDLWDFEAHCWKDWKVLAFQMPSFLLKRLLSKTSLGCSPPKDLFKLNIDMQGPGPFLFGDTGCGYLAKIFNSLIPGNCTPGFTRGMSWPSSYCCWISSDPDLKACGPCGLSYTLGICMASHLTVAPFKGPLG